MSTLPFGLIVAATTFVGIGAAINVSGAASFDKLNSLRTTDCSDQRLLHTPRTSLQFTCNSQVQTF